MGDRPAATFQPWVADLPERERRRAARDALPGVVDQFVLDRPKIENSHGVTLRSRTTCAAGRPVQPDDLCSRTVTDRRPAPAVPCSCASGP